MKILIIGQAPGKHAVSTIPFYGGATAKRLWKWFGVNSKEELDNIADLINAVPWLEGTHGKGDRRPTDKAVLIQLKIRLIEKIEEGKYKKVILVGKFAEEMIKDYLSALENDIQFITVFHPSGANIWCNGQDENMKQKINKFLKEN